tara:strand:+ start:129 stop:308 length:180 start_codon:yes stop_codon:yes gene_type:complete
MNHGSCSENSSNQAKLAMHVDRNTKIVRETAQTETGHDFQMTSPQQMLSSNFESMDANQ